MPKNDPGGARHPFAYPPSFRLLKHAWYQACYAEGRKYHTPHFIVFTVDRGDATFCRTGVTVSKKVGNSVHRNRVKRVLREFFRRTLHPVYGRLRAVDLVVVVKKQAGIALDLRLAERELCPLLERIFHTT